MITDQEIVAYALAHEYDCKCVGDIGYGPGLQHPCYCCVINALRAEVARLQDALIDSDNMLADLP